MSSPYSPIDESSFTDTAFDPEVILNGNGDRYAETGAERIPYSPKPDVNAENPKQHNPAPANSEIPTPEAMTSHPSNEKNARQSLKRTFQLIRDSRTVMFLGIVLVFAAGYALIVAMSYFYNIGTDQSAMLNGDFDPEMIKNAGGPFGAWLAHTLIYNWLGLGSFILIYYTAMCGIAMLKVYRPSFWALTLRCLLTAVALSVICGFVTYEISSPIFWGGRHGHLLNERLMILTGFWGALAVTLIMGGLVVILYLTELKRSFVYLNERISIYRQRQAERKAERERIREENEAIRREQEAKDAAKRAEQEAVRLAEEQRIALEKAEADRIDKEKVEMEKLTDTSNEGTEPVGSESGLTTSESLFNPTMPLEEKPRTDSDSIDPSPSARIQIEADNSISTASPTASTPLWSEVTEKDDTGETDDELSPLFTSGKEEISDSDIAETSHLTADIPLFINNRPETSKPTSESRNDVIDSITSEEGLFDPRAELSHYRFPSIDFLRPAKESGPSVDAQEMEENKIRITETLNHYGIPISKIEATVGPTVTLYEIIPAEGVRIAKIKRLEDDIALSLAALGIRIIAPIPGKGTIGIEVPNKDPQVVSMRSIIESATYANSHMELPMAMGRTISNEVFMADLCKMPHLLVAGATGMGKSVGLNTIIASLLYKKHPSELKFVLIDPKMVEFSLYARLERHYLAKLPEEEDAIITDPSKVVATLNSLCVEMDNRYALLKEASMRNIKEYNDKFIHRHLNPEKGHRFLPYIVVIVDEFADLIMTAGKEVETPIARIAQKARAVGIHMILATQRPSTNVITGVIKANFPGRIAFRVFQMVDSRTIIDRPGANQLIGRGDMLFSNNGKLDRVQCAFIDTPEVSAICESISEQVGYPNAYELPEYIAENTDGGKLASVGDRDPLFDECARLVVTTDTASTSSLQRRYSIGYNRAGKIMDQMEAAGIVGPSRDGKPRQVLVDSFTLERILENN